MLLLRPNTRGALMALVAFAIFATHDIVVKTLGASYAPFQIIFFSVLFSFPLVTMLLIRDRTDGNLRPRHLWWTMTRTGAAVITGVTAFYAFSVLPLADVYAIIFASPLIITLLAIPILGEKVGIRRALAILAGLIGVLVVLRPGGGSGLGLGHLAALTAAVCSSLASVIVRKIGKDERAAVLLLYPMLANFVVMGAAMPFVYHPMPVLHLGYLGIIALFSFCAMLCITAYRQAEAVIVAPMQYSQMIWALIYGWLIFDEIPDTTTLVGAAIIMASGVYIVLREGTGRASNTRPVLQTRSRAETGLFPRVGFLLRRSSETHR